MAAMTEDQRRTVETLLTRLESDQVQARLRSGFERDFSNSILDQWQRSDWLSEKQLYWLREIVNRHSQRVA